MLILTGDKVGRMDWEELTHRFHELESLLRECPDMPQDHPLKKELEAIRAILDPK